MQSPAPLARNYYLRIVYLMYFGEEVDEGLNGGGSPVLWGVLMAAAAIMVFGIVNLFGINGSAASAAAALVN